MNVTNHEADRLNLIANAVEESREGFVPLDVRFAAAAAADATVETWLVESEAAIQDELREVREAVDTDPLSVQALKNAEKALADQHDPYRSAVAGAWLAISQQWQDFGR